MVEALQELLSHEMAFLAPALEAYQQLQLGRELQDQVWEHGVWVQD